MYSIATNIIISAIYANYHTTIVKNNTVNPFISRRFTIYHMLTSTQRLDPSNYKNAIAIK